MCKHIVVETQHELWVIKIQYGYAFLVLGCPGCGPLDGCGYSFTKFTRDLCKLHVSAKACNLNKTLKKQKNTFGKQQYSRLNRVTVFSFLDQSK